MPVACNRTNVCPSAQFTIQPLCWWLGGYAVLRQQSIHIWKLNIKTLLWLDCLSPLYNTWLSKILTYDEQFLTIFGKIFNTLQHLKFRRWQVLKNFTSINFCRWHILKNVADIYIFAEKTKNCENVCLGKFFLL